jgi:hypothetical protein
MRLTLTSRSAKVGAVARRETIHTLRSQHLNVPCAVDTRSLPLKLPGDAVGIFYGVQMVTYLSVLPADWMSMAYPTQAAALRSNVRGRSLAGYGQGVRQILGAETTLEVIQRMIVKK